MSFDNTDQVFVECAYCSTREGAPIHLPLDTAVRWAREHTCAQREANRADT